MKRNICLILVLIAAIFLLTACHSDPDPLPPLPSGEVTAAPAAEGPTSTPTEEEQAAEEIQQPDPEPTPGGDAAPGLNG